MNATRLTATIAGTATLLLGAALSSSAAAAPSDSSAVERTSVAAVFYGKALSSGTGPDLSGNKHQVHITTQGGVGSGYIRSWFCPSYASVSPTWASVHCTHRSTMKFASTTSKFGNVSSTGLSATLRGEVYARTYSGYGSNRTFESDLAMYERNGEKVLRGTFARARYDRSVASQVTFSR